MAKALFSFKVDNDGRVRVAHVFFAASQPAADAELQQHAATCPQFGPAYRADKTIEFAREIPTLPPADGDALEEWLDDWTTEEAATDIIDMEPDDDDGDDE